jgi:hypothetical protein
LSADDSYILRPSDYEFYQKSNFPAIFPGYDPKKFLRPPDQLQIDINRAHDNLKRQQVVNDKLYRQWRMAETRLARAEKRVIWLWAALGATWASWIGVIWWVSQQLAPVVWKALQSPK